MPASKSPNPEWDRPTYSAAEAGRLVDLEPTRVRRWLMGYGYRYAEGKHHQRPLVRRQGTAGSTYASFLDLIDLLFVKRFVDHGVSLQRVRKALDEAAEILGTDHFARRTFFTDGRGIYLQVKERGDAILELLSHGQWVIADIIKELAFQIDFDTPSGFARRWYPLGPAGLVVIDPFVSFGRPCIVGRGITTSNVFDLFAAEDRDVPRVCSWMSLNPREVKAAVEFELRLAA